MICIECGREMKIVCRFCQAARTRRGMLLHQKRFLQTWLVGEIDLRVKRKDGILHLELFDDRWHSYCDLAMFDVPRSEFVKNPPGDLCGDCLKVFKDLVEKAGKSVA